MPTEQWRVGRRNGHNVYRQQGPDPRGMEHEDADESLGFFADPKNATKAAEAVTALAAMAARGADRIDGEVWAETIAEIAGTKDVPWARRLVADRRFLALVDAVTSKERKPEVVSGKEAADLPVGSIVIRDYSEHDYVGHGFRVPYERFPLTRTPEGFRAHHEDPRPDGLAEWFRVLLRAPALARPARTLAVGQEVTGDDAVNAPMGTTLRCTTSPVVALRTDNGWRLSLFCCPEEGYVRANAWRVIDLPTTSDEESS